MLAEFRTLDGAIAMREVQFPPPDRMSIPFGAQTPRLGIVLGSREYVMAGTANEIALYREVPSVPEPPVHAALSAEFDACKANSYKIAVALESERAAHANTKRLLADMKSRTASEHRELARADALYKALKEFLA